MRWSGRNAKRSQCGVEGRWNLGAESRRFLQHSDTELVVILAKVFSVPELSDPSVSRLELFSVVPMLVGYGENMNVTGKQESKICVMTWTVSETATRAAVVRCLHCADPEWPRHTAIIPLTQSPGGPCPHYPGQPRSPAKPGTSHSVAQTPQRGCWVQTNLLPYTTAEQSGEQTQLRW